MNQSLLIAGLSAILSTTAAAQAPPDDLLFVPLPVLPRVELTLAMNDVVQGAEIWSDQAHYAGAVILSLSPAMQTFACCLPPILADYVVLGFGIANDHALQFPFGKPLPAIAPGDEPTIHGQALVLTLADMRLTASAVQQLDFRN